MHAGNECYTVFYTSCPIASYMFTTTASQMLASCILIWVELDHNAQYDCSK